MSRFRWIWLAVSVLAVAWLLRYAPIFILSLLVLLGFSPDCKRQEGILACYRRLVSNQMTEKARKSTSVLRDDGRYRLMQTSQGPFWEVKAANGSSEVAAQVAEVDSKYVRSDPVVNAGDVVLDCGANVGVFTRYALAHGAKKVLAIEPAADNLECLRRNTRDDSRVIICPVGVWDREDTLVLYESAEVSARDSFVETQKARAGNRVPLTTIDKLVEKEQLPRVDFIKMDIEGAESRALRGARETLHRYHPRLELEATEEPSLLLAIAREAWPGYASHCVMCDIGVRWKPIRPMLIALR